MQALHVGIAPHRLVVASETANNLTAGSGDPDLATAEIAFGQPEPEQIAALDSLRWIHLTSAGYTRYDTDQVRAALKQRGAILTNSSSVYDEPCAQHLLAFMLAGSRRLPESVIAQSDGPRWDYDRLRPETRLLQGSTALLVGYGAIAKRLAQLLAPFDLNLIAFRRQVRGDETVPTYPIERLGEFLPTADHVVNILPANDSTNALFGNSLFDLFKPGAGLYNIGRGTTVDQAALIAALESGRLGLAYLDVTDPEPLPSNHPLWTTPNCWITPHIGGGHANEHIRLVEHFLENLKRFESGSPLLDRVM